jgi:hypothetical protein
VNGLVRNTNSSQAIDALGLLFQVAESVAAAIAAGEVAVDLATPGGLQFTVEVATQGEQAAPHMTSSR